MAAAWKGALLALLLLHLWLLLLWAWGADAEFATLVWRACPLQARFFDLSCNAGLGVFVPESGDTGLTPGGGGGLCSTTREKWGSVLGGSSRAFGFGCPALLTGGRIGFVGTGRVGLVE